MASTKINQIIHSSWNTLIDDFQYSTKDFYKLLLEELKSHGIKGIKISSKSHREGNLASSKRLYLRVKYKKYHYDCCLAPFGNGTFISWWLVMETSRGAALLSLIPILGPWLASKIYTFTYFKVDTASMFMSYAQSSVLKVIDQITKDAGVRAIPDNERKPILSDVFKR